LCELEIALKSKARGPDEGWDPRFNFNGDNRVSLGDFAMFGTNYGRKEGDEKWDERFDLTGDGRVDMSDFYLFRDAYNTRGPDPNWDEESDLDKDGIITKKDKEIFFEGYEGPVPESAFQIKQDENEVRLYRRDNSKWTLRENELIVKERNATIVLDRDGNVSLITRKDGVAVVSPELDEEGNLINGTLRRPDGKAIVLEGGFISELMNYDGAVLSVSLIDSSESFEELYGNSETIKGIINDIQELSGDEKAFLIGDIDVRFNTVHHAHLNTIDQAIQDGLDDADKTYAELVIEREDLESQVEIYLGLDTDEQRNGLEDIEEKFNDVHQQQIGRVEQAIEDGLNDAGKTDEELNDEKLTLENMAEIYLSEDEKELWLNSIRDKYEFITATLTINPLPQVITQGNLLADWEEVSNATSYTLQLSTESNFDPLVQSTDDITLPSFQLTALEEGVEYYLRVRASKGSTLGAWSDVVTIQALDPVSQLEHTDAAIRKEAIIVIGESGTTQDRDILIAHIMNEPDENNRNLIIEVVADIGSEQDELVAQNINNLLYSEDREDAIYVLENIGDPRAIEPLKIILLDNELSYDIRESTSRALDGVAQKSGFWLGDLLADNILQYTGLTLDFIHSSTLNGVADNLLARDTFILSELYKIYDNQAAMYIFDQYDISFFGRYNVELLS
ncbi:hypothetical protein ACFL60_10130, partial [Candidatus Omnitrophota bacterium]